MSIEPDPLLDSALKALPPPSAPRSLLPRVMAAVAQAERPWHQRAWLTWPLGWQLLSAASVSVLFVAALLAPDAFRTISVLAPGGGGSAAGAVQQTIHAIRELMAASEALGTIYRLIVLPSVFYAALALALTGAACAASIATIATLTFGRPQR